MDTTALREWKVPAAGHQSPCLDFVWYCCRGGKRPIAIHAGHAGSRCPESQRMQGFHYISLVSLVLLNVDYFLELLF